MYADPPHTFNAPESVRGYPRVLNNQDLRYVFLIADPKHAVSM